MSRILAADVPTFARLVAGTVTLRSLARSLRRIADEQALAFHAAVKAEGPRKWQTELRRLYTSGKRKPAR